MLPLIVLALAATAMTLAGFERATRWISMVGFAVERRASRQSRRLDTTYARINLR
ncbi:hypothetical protein [Rhodopseudomonas palustris]|uniref:hypothetical protein n=1 Tax=Rhodopseudomonas palustris TaxID=1076 RepID=UPI0014029D14|nr:hypothetical protein [Rhodopseudomonas palustris]QLH73241.1 hypothetical protein HZF03_21510 [Rhodopseudomonas palustris]